VIITIGTQNNKRVHVLLVFPPHCCYRNCHRVHHITFRSESWESSNDLGQDQDTLTLLRPKRHMVICELWLLVSDHRIIRVPVLLVLHCIALQKLSESTSYYIPVWKLGIILLLGSEAERTQFASPQKAYRYLKTGVGKISKYVMRNQNKQFCYANCLLNSVTRVSSDSDIEPWIEKHNPSVVHKDRSKRLLTKSVIHKVRSNRLLIKKQQCTSSNLSKYWFS
jgi:hypothetical protein